MDRPLRERMVIRSNLAEAAAVEQAIMEAVAAHGYTENACFAIRLSLDEALANAIHHGNRDDPRKSVTVEYAIDDEAVTITICDEGCGFSPSCLPDPTLPSNLERPNGRGVMLIRAYMSQVSYNDCGNCVTMVKRRDCQLPLSS